MEEVPVDDIVSGFEFAVDAIDWRDANVTASAVSKKLMGSCQHWRPSNRPGHLIGLTHLELEIQTLRDAGWKNWNGESWAGKPYHQHMLTLIKLMMPRTDIHTTLSDAVKLFCLCLGNKRKGMHMIGSQNCSKSGTSVRISMAVMAVFPSESAVYFANPFDSASDSTIWGEVEECYDEIKNHAAGIFPDSVKYALRKIELVPGIPRAGTMEIRNVKHVGKFKGTKTAKGGEAEGLILLVIDEVNEIYTFAFLRMLANLVSQEGFFALSSQNFKDPGDMGGQLTTPRRYKGQGPNEFSALNEKEDKIWHSYGGSVTIRFSGLDSPNIRAGRDIYDYLFTLENLKFMRETYGEQSPEWFSQVLSFPMEGDDASSVLSSSRINGSRHDDNFFAIEGATTKVSFCDPSFGGGDNAMWGMAEFGRISYLDAQSNKHYCNAIIFGKMMNIPISKTFVVTQDTLLLMTKLGVDTSAYPLGSIVSVEDQVSMKSLEWNMQEGIPSTNFGYDYSMRPDCMVSMSKIIGSNCIPFDYNTEPQGYWIQSLKGDSKERCRNRVDELAFLTSDLFANQRVRGGSAIPAAILQLSRTRYEIRHGKRIVEKKKDYKARWQNQSPDERDVLMGNVGMAYRLGFKIVDAQAQAATERRDAMKLYRTPKSGNSKLRRKVGKRLKYE